MALLPLPLPPLVHKLYLRKILIHSFKFYSIWPQAGIDTRVQCSPASVGLAKARPKLYTV